MKFLEVYDAYKILDSELLEDYYDNGYVGVYYSRDVHDIHVFRVLNNCNSNYEYESDVFLLEYDKVPIWQLGELGELDDTQKIIQTIAKIDSCQLESWMCEEFYEYDRVVNKITDSYTENIITSLGASTSNIK